MASERSRVLEFIRGLLALGGVEDYIARLRPKHHPMPRRVPGASSVSPTALERRWQLAGARPLAIADEASVSGASHYAHNIEHYIGTIKVPVGIAGPLRVNGLFAQGDFYVPLATTEAALVASYSRGACLLTEAGGCTAVLLNEGVTRAPGFAFASLEQASLFVAWAVGQMEQFREVAESTTRYGKLIDLRVTLEGNHAYLQFEFTTGDAAGQNMVTIATEAICRYVERHSPIKPDYWFLEANLSGDKKASSVSFLAVRGKKVSAEAVIPNPLIEGRLRTTAESMTNYWRMAAMGGVMSGSMGVHGHYANGLAALFLATGQDVACVAECAMGVTRFETRGDGDLYASVTLPNVIVGTIGGGCGLPSQNEALQILRLEGTGQARALAEIAASICLAGELSIIGAFCSGDFATAHARLARGKDKSR